MLEEECSFQVEKSLSHPCARITVRNKTLENIRKVMIPKTFSSLNVHWLLSTVQAANVTVSLLLEAMRP